MDKHVVMVLEPNRDVRSHIVKQVSALASEHWKLVAPEVNSVVHVDPEVKIQRPVAALVDAHFALAEDGAVGHFLREHDVLFAAYAHSWDIRFGTTLMQLGSRDMLHYPPNDWVDFIRAINRLVELKTGIVPVVHGGPDRAKRLPAGHLYVFHGRKDADVGEIVTSAAAELRTVLAGSTLSVAVVDLDLVDGDIAVRFGLQECWDHNSGGRFTVKGKNILALMQKYPMPWTYEQIQEFMVHHPASNVKVLASPFLMNDVDPSTPMADIARNILKEVAPHNDITLVNCPAGPLELVLTLIEVASKSVHVVAPAPLSIRFSSYLIGQLSQIGWPVAERVRVVINKATDKIPGFSQAGVAEWFRRWKVPVLPVFPHTLASVASAYDGIPFVLANPDQYGDQKAWASHEIAATALWKSLLGIHLKSREDRRIEKEKAGSLLNLFDVIFKGNKDTHGGQTPPPIDPRQTNPF